MEDQIYNAFNAIFGGISDNICCWCWQCWFMSMAKNTTMHRIIQGQLSKNANLEKLLLYVHENIGFIFTKEYVSKITQKLFWKIRLLSLLVLLVILLPLMSLFKLEWQILVQKEQVFFQALQIPTKITRGRIEIINNVHLIKAGD